ncbi:MAG: hypothetical protein J6B76_06535 [Peptococcaceae bacterium]|nr:hypothetical protein [Peptococcaceae bacterium]
MNDFELREKELFTNLFNAEWNNKKVWEYIRDNELTATPAFVGDLYYDSDVKVMFVGRALNGWNEPLGDCSTLENTVESIINQTGAFDTFIDARGFGDGARKYYHKNSNFFRFIKHVLELLNESDKGGTETWYNDSKRWNQRFVWANLYCLAPKNPKPGEDPNPQNSLIKPCIDDYIDLMELYIKNYKPDVVIFITDIDGWFVKWKRTRSFKNIVDNYQEFTDGNVIVAEGEIGTSKIIVCKRPDRRGLSYENVKQMAQTIVDKVLKV